MNKRHAKPTSAQLLARIYRRQLAMESETRSALAMLSTRMESFRVIVDHCARLLKEKETLMSMIDQQRGLNEPVWENPMPTGGGGAKLGTIMPSATGTNGAPSQLTNVTCAFASTHRPGVRCAVCEGGI